MRTTTLCLSRAKLELWVEADRHSTSQPMLFGPFATRAEASATMLVVAGRPDVVGARFTIAVAEGRNPLRSDRARENATALEAQRLRHEAAIEEIGRNVTVTLDPIGAAPLIELMMLDEKVPWTDEAIAPLRDAAARLHSSCEASPISPRSVETRFGSR